MANFRPHFLFVTTILSIVITIVRPQFTGFENSEEMTLLNPVQTPRPRRSCESMSSCDISDRFEGKYVNLERRIRSLEQPVWKLSGENFRWSECAEGPCRCSPESFGVNCWRLQLDVIPQQQTIPLDTTVLDMGANMVDALHKHTFRGLIRLIQLDMSDNHLDYLPETIFENLESLKYLVLHRNRLDAVNPSIFRDLKNLETLDLSENHLTRFSDTMWQSMASLRILQLSRNKLVEWVNFNNGLVSLEDLDLTGNLIEKLGNFSNLRKLRRLKLAGNSLGVINSNTFLGLHSLQSLSLQQNKIVGLPANLFLDLGEVSEIDLSDNLIKEIFPENFNGLTSLKNLNLARNELTSVTNGTFEALSGLDRLSIHGNILDNLEPGAFKGMGSLRWLLLGNNILSELSGVIFHPVPNLTRLELDSNDLLYIADDTFEIFQHLSSIKLGKNSWQCDCHILYLCNWIRDHSPIVLDYQPKCRGPTSQGGRPLHEITFSDACDDGGWLSMQRTSIPSRVHRIYN